MSKTTTSTQPEALRLADLIDHGADSTQIEREAAAELRRLGEVEKERDRLQKANQAMEQQVNTLTDALAKAKADERKVCVKAADDQWVRNPNVSGGEAIRAMSKNEEHT